MASSGQVRRSAREGRATARQTVAPSPLGRRPVVQAAAPEAEAADTPSPNSNPERSGFLGMTLGFVSKAVSRFTPRRKSVKPPTAPAEPSNQEEEERRAAGPAPPLPDQEREGSEYGTPEAQVRPSPSKSPSLPLSSGPAQAEATFHPRTNLNEALATEDPQPPEPPGFAHVLGSLGNDPRPNPVALFQRLRQGSPLPQLPQRLVAGVHSPATRFAFTPDARNGAAAQATGPLLHSGAGAQRVATPALRRGTSGRIEPLPRGPSILDRQPVPQRQSMGGFLGSARRSLAASPMPMRIESANRAELMRSQAAKRSQPSDRPPPSAKRVRFNPPVPSTPAAGLSRASFGGTPLLGMGIQPAAYQSPSLSRLRPAPLPLPSPRPTPSGLQPDGLFSRRRGLVDAAPSPMAPADLRTANAGQTPGVGRSQGLKRSAGAEPSWAYRPEQQGEVLGQSSTPVPALLSAAGDGEDLSSAQPSSKRPKYSSPGAARLDSILSKHKEESAGQRDIHAELEAAYSPGNRQPTGKRSNREPMPAPPMGSLSEAPAAPAPWLAVGPAHGSPMTSDRQPRRQRQRPEANYHLSRFRPRHDVEEETLALPAPNDEHRAGSPARPPPSGSFSFNQQGQQLPPTPGFKGSVQDTSSLPNGHPSFDPHPAPAASFTSARPTTQDGLSDNAATDDFLDSFMVPAETHDRPNFWKEPFQPAKPSQASSLLQPSAAGKVASQSNGGPTGKAARIDVDATRVAAPSQRPVHHDAKHQSYDELPPETADAAKGEASKAQAVPLPDSDSEDGVPVSTTEDDGGGDEPLLSGQMSGEFNQPSKAMFSAPSTAQDSSGLLDFLSTVGPKNALPATGKETADGQPSAPPAAKPAPVASGWGDAFLASNKQHASAAADNAKQQLDEAQGGSSKPSAPPAFGASSAAQASEGPTPTIAPFKFGAPPATSAAPSLFTFGTSSASPGPSFSFGAKASSTPALGAQGASAPFTFGTSSTPSFSFGSSTAAMAPPQPSGSTPDPSKGASKAAADVASNAPEQPPTAAQANGDVASKSASPAPFSFKFGQGIGDGSSGNAAASPKPGSTPVAIPAVTSPRGAAEAAASLGSPSGYDAMSISPPHAQSFGLPDHSQPPASQSTETPASAPFAFGQAAPNSLPQPTSVELPIQTPGPQSSAMPAASASPAAAAAANGPAFGSSTPAFGSGAPAPGGLFAFGQSNTGFGGQSSAASFGFGASGGFSTGFGAAGGGGVMGFGASQPAAASAVAAPGPEASSATAFSWGAAPASLLASNGLPAVSGTPPTSGGSSGFNPFAIPGGSSFSLGSSGPQQGFAFGAAASQPAPGPFGTAAPAPGIGAAPNPFGQGPPVAFGANPAPAFGANSTPAFGSSAPVFGTSAPAFGSSAPAFGGAGTGFGASGGFAFGGGQAPAFGGPAASQPSLFGGGQPPGFMPPQQQQQQEGAPAQAPGGMTLGAASGDDKPRKMLRAKRRGR
ncbi:hypothetical protein WJX74_010870 [Apatococcus lobatus]|uniref:Uncharacterized protein n=1 Tax=Apatococcus lobatus TaxID=904363 RepID=A0AAW1RIB2_9CHLO